ncbi:MBL fold metallo-hydrolase [Bradyrhizobium septentrionale]|nr:MBL fold metallo-hydrolase [Bradyrhizobium septentrionale]UGY17969.1 MBL fold metallo-hydrolase [Bradyrhizobium septentrionale]
MLIDCGTWGPVSALKAAMQHLKKELPDAGAGKRQLDLLVVTHEHKDHIAGFDADLCHSACNIAPLSRGIGVQN